MSGDIVARLRRTRWRDDANRLHNQYDSNGCDAERAEAALAIERLQALVAREVAEGDWLRVEITNLRRLTEAYNDLALANERFRTRGPDAEP